MSQYAPAKTIWISVWSTAVLLIAFGAGFRLLSAHYARAGVSVPLPPGTLDTLPEYIDGWIGVDEPLASRVVEATKTDDHLSRVYRRGGSSVVLFIGYGVNLRDLAPHRPEVCYRGAGWTRDGTQRIDDLKLSDGTLLSCQIHHFHRGGLAGERTTVLHYYVVDGQMCADVSLLRSRAARPAGETYAAQVQIVCGGSVPPEVAERLVREFASSVTPLILELIETAVADSASKTAQRPLESLES